jgi:hypothetical protein
LSQVVDRPRRLVFTSTMTMPDGSSIDTRIEVTFDDENGGIRMTITQSGFPAPELRDDFTGGWGSILDRLGRVAAARTERSGCPRSTTAGRIGLDRDVEDRWPDGTRREEETP